MARRSESCPRMARKDPTQQVQPLAPQPLALSAPRSCTLQDLGPEDRQKVAKLLKQVVDLGQELQQLKQQRDELTEQAKAAATREQELQEGNQQLHKEHQSLKKKLGQVLLVLRASQAKIIALEAAQQAAPRRPGCSVEVQTELASSAAELEPQASVASSAPGGGEATPPALPTGGAEPPGATGSAAALRASLSGPPGGPPVLHVAPGAHVNITIHRAPEPAPSAGPSAAPPGAGTPIPAGRPSAATAAAAAAAPRPCTPDDSCDEAASTTFAPRLGNAGEYGLALAGTPAPAAAAVVSVPTTTAATAIGATAAVAASSGAAGCESTEVSLPELPGRSTASSSSFSTTAASAAWAGRDGAAGWPMQQHRQHPVAAREPRDDGAGPAVMPRAPPCGGAASAGAMGQHPVSRPVGPRHILVDATMQRFEDVPVHEVRVDSHETLTASPMIVPPSDEVVAAASSLMGWQAQHNRGFATDAEAEAATASSARSGPAGARTQQHRSGRKVLSFDPAIGQSGAFYFVDVASGQVGAGIPGAAAAAAGPAQAHRLGPDGEFGGQHPVAERFAGSAGPQPAPHPFTHGSEATLRPWADAPVGAGPPGGPVGVSATHLPQYQQHPQPHPQSHPHQHNQQYRQYQQQQQHPSYPVVSERGGLASPCSSYASDSVAGQLQPYTDTPASTTISLSRMAVALDEVARRQRWDVQPPVGLVMPPPQQQQQHQDAAQSGGGGPPQARRGGGGGHATQLSAGGGGVLGARHAGGPGGQVDYGATSTQATGFPYGARSYQDPHGGQGPSPQLLRHASAGSVGTGAAMRSTVGLGPFEGGPDAAPHAESLSACDSTSTWLGGNDVADRYDDSLVDILSQADEELEQQQHQHQQQHRQRYRPPPQAHRPLSQAASVPAPVPTRPRAAPSTASPLSEGAALRSKMQAASAEALLAANLYEENDVFSVILEQEGRM